MNRSTVFRSLLLYAAPLLGMILAPLTAFPCACGCFVFDVGTPSLFPEKTGAMLSFEYDYQDQTHNWSGLSKAPASNNGDKEIRTSFYTGALEYQFNRSWGAGIEVPYDNRFFSTEGGASGNQVESFNWGQIGDIRIKGVYTGFSPDMSSGLTFGVKLPTGGFHHNDAYGDIDRDSQLGTGSTDLLLGGYTQQAITRDKSWSWFAQAQLDLPVFTQDAYRPGVEIDAAAGIAYNAWYIGRARIRPIAQVIASERTRDTGANASGGANDDPEDGVSSGYQRILLSPGIEVDLDSVSLLANAELPVLEHITGNQLVAPVLVKVVLSYHF